MIGFIDIRRKSPNESEDTAHFSVTDTDPHLRVGGGLPHGTRIEPLTTADARKWIEWLEAWVAEQTGEER